MKVRAVVLFFLSIAFYDTAGQKIQYSDIYVLLEGGQLSKAEPFLARYLSNNKNNPSANLFMGRIFEEKIFLTRDQSRLQVFVDSALHYYSLSLKQLSQKEIDKNQDYYRTYRRRDLKTGKMKVSILDIKMDIETRVQNLQTISRALGIPAFNNILQDKFSTNTTSESDKETVQSLKKIDGKYYAIIVGIANYDSSRLNLDRPVKDALDLKNTLESYYEFEKENIYTLLNPTRQQILLALYGLRKRVSVVDNLLIFYAGHGYWDPEVEQGYWWPRDASPVNPANWLSNSDIREQIRGIKTAHTLLISDACFSGGIFKARSATSIKDAPMDIVSLYKIPSRRAITSGTLTEVPDKSVFFTYMIKRLKENQEQFLTSQSLFDSFKKAVIHNSMLVPQDGVIADTGDEGGDFIFIKRKK